MAGSAGNASTAARTSRPRFEWAVDNQYQICLGHDPESRRRNDARHRHAGDVLAMSVTAARDPATVPVADAAAPRT